MTLARCLALLVALVLGTTQYATAWDITGGWSFETKIKSKGCVISGNMTILPPDENGIRTGHFISREICNDDPDLSWQVEQETRITPQAESFIMRSEVVASLTPNYSANRYLPDHFVVSPKSATQMTGIWQDSAYSAPVKFWRDDSLPIS